MQREELERHSKILSVHFDDLARRCSSVSSKPGEKEPRPHPFETLAEVLNSLTEDLVFDLVALGLHDTQNNVVSVVLQAGSCGLPSEIPVLRESLDAVLSRGDSLEIANAETETRPVDLIMLLKDTGLSSVRIIPLAASGQATGILLTGRKKAGSFSREDVRVLHHAAREMALAVENMLLCAALGEERLQLETLLELNAALVSSLDIQRIVSAVSRSISSALPHDFLHLALRDKTDDSMKFYVAGQHIDAAEMSRGAPFAECPEGAVVRSGKAMHVAFADLQSIDSDYAQRLLNLGIRSMYILPLVGHGRVMGTLGVASVHDDSFAAAMPLLDQIVSPVAMAVENARAYEEIARFKDKFAKEKLYLEEELRSEHNFGEVIGNSPALKQVLKQVEIAAPSGATVLILGETGTGKELVARAVHRLSSRREGNFIKLNCAAIPTGLLESELFGHEKGAFTGAINQKIGRLELADKGTLFLDEIGEISMELQPKLLRVLQDHEFERLGGNRTIHVNVRLVAATNRDLAEAVEEKQFRSDLFYRLNVFPIRLPALRERAGDIPILVRYFVQKFARRMGKNIESIPSEIIRQFEQWHWPGNVRELENFIERSVILTPGEVFFAPMTELQMISPERSRRPGSTLESVERDYILRTLRESGGVIAGVRGAAARLGMKRTTLQSRMQKLGIRRDEYET